MTTLRNTGFRIVILLILQALWLATSHAQSPDNSKIKEEVSKQESIYQSRGVRVPDGYTVDRSLQNYTDALPIEFDRALANLGPADRWLDIGAGAGQAILDYYSAGYDETHLEGQAWRGRKAQAVAISIEDRRTPRWQLKSASLETNQLKYLVNRRLREYSVSELGKFQIITDVIGGFSYTTDLTLFMEKVLGFLELNGSFYSVLQDVHTEKGTNQPFYAASPFLTEITNPSGAEVRICSWLKSITCVQVACEARAGWKPPIEAFSVRKICNEVAVPALVPVHYEAGTPPERRFQTKN